MPDPQWTGNESEEQKAHIRELNYRWMLISQQGRELVWEGLRPGKLEERKPWSLLDFFSDHGPFNLPETGHPDWSDVADRVLYQRVQRGCHEHFLARSLPDVEGLVFTTN
jgi:hypothetical protein